MIEQAIAKALEELRAERDRLDEECKRIDGAIAALESATARTTPRKRGRPAGSRKAAKTRSRTSKPSGRAPRGLLRSTLHKILAGAKGPLTASVLRDKVLASRYPVSNPKNLYVTVYQSLGNDPAVRKTKAGYSLIARAVAGGGSAKKSKKKATKKKARRRTAKKAGRRAKKKKATAKKIRRKARGKATK